MTVPSLVVNQNGISQVSSDNLNGFMSGGAVVSTLRSFIGVTGMTVSIIGFSALNDGGFGFFAWNAGGTSPDDNGVTTIVPNGSANGCWTRLGSTSSGGTIVNSIDSPGDTISVSSSSGVVALDINLDNANVWVASQTIPLASASTAVTQSNGDDSTKVATTQFVRIAVSPVPTETVFTSGSGTYNPPTQALWLRIRMCGGGGGGGGTGSSGSSAGGVGGNTTFSTFTANGGGGGGAGSTGPGFPGAGGTASGGNINNTRGNSGAVGGYNVSGSGTGSGGNGGAGVWGGSGTGGVFGISGSVAGATNSGAGGGAGQGVPSVTAAGSGGGAGGYVESIIFSLSASYSYTVGSGGTSGGAGVSGTPGAAGGSGIIIIEEYYVG